MKYSSISQRYSLFLSVWLVLVTLAACQGSAASVPLPEKNPATAILQTSPPGLPVSSTRQMPKEYPVRILPLGEPVNAVQTELSGLAWANDTLLLLPQYPERFQQAARLDSFGALFGISRKDILDLVDGKSDAPLHAKAIPIYAPNLKQKILGYEGFESMFFFEGKVFFTIETHQSDGMAAFLMGGVFSPDLSEIRLDTNNISMISAQASIPNFSDEAITLINNQLITFYEANGANFLPSPVAHRFDLDGLEQGVISSPNLEYRITDATPADSDGRFWVINYFFPGDVKITPSSDPIFNLYGKPLTHSRSKVVERLVQMQWTEKQINLVARSPVYLELLSGDTARNWEGIALFDQRGFLLVTDSYPSTMLGFVAFPY